MKKIFTLLVLMLGCVGQAFAHDFIVNNICYNIIDSEAGTVETTYYKNSTLLNSNSYAFYRYDNTVQTKGVVHNYESVYGSYGQLFVTFYYKNEVTIPNSVEYNGKQYDVVAIGDYTFCNCKTLTVVNVPSSVKKIGTCAFAAASGAAGTTSGFIDRAGVSSSLTEVRFEANSELVEIGDNAFSFAPNLTDLEIPAAIEKISATAFNNSTLKALFCSAPLPPEYLLSTTKQLSPILMVPEGMQNFYAEVSPWCNYAHIIGCNYADSYPQNAYKMSYRDYDGSVISESWVRRGNNIVAPEVGEREGYDFSGWLPEVPQTSENSGTFVAQYSPHLVSSVSLNKSKLSMAIGEEMKLTASVSPEDAVIKNMNWTSTNTQVIRVENNGTVKAVGPGEAAVVATSTDGSDVSATCEILVFTESSTFDFTTPSTLNPNLVTSEEEDDFVTLSDEQYEDNGVKLEFSLGTRTNYSAREWTMAGPSYYLTLYKGAAMTISTPKESKIIQIIVNGDGYDNLAFNTGVFTSGKWSGSEQNVTITALENAKIESIYILTASIDKQIVDGESYIFDFDQENVDVTYSRSFSSTNWQALYVPFSMKYDDWKDKLDVYDIYNVLAYDEDNNGEIERTTVNMIRLKEGAVTEPNYPYVVRAKNAGDVKITLTDGTLYAAEENSIDCTSTKQKFTFTGTYEPMTGLATKGYYALSGGILKTAEDDTVPLKPQRWYMEVTNRDGSPTAATRVYLNPFGEENEVEGVKGVAVNVIGEETTYDLNGRTVNAAQLPKGLYVRGGKRIIVK